LALALTACDAAPCAPTDAGLELDASSPDLCEPAAWPPAATIDGDEACRSSDYVSPADGPCDFGDLPCPWAGRLCDADRIAAFFAAAPTMTCAEVIELYSCLALA